MSKLLRKLLGRRNAVVSFPKAGRTWLRVMLDELGVEVEYTHAGSHHGRREPISAISTGSARKYHRIVFLHRDPRDTAVSGFHQMVSRKKGGYDGSLAEFIRDPNHGIEKIMDFNRMWFEVARRRKRVKVVSYEALRADTVGELAALIAFFGHTPDRERIAAIVEANTFARMQKKEATGAFSDKWGHILTPKNPDDPDSFKVRRGQIGGYRDELSAEDVAYCDEVIARSGYAEESLRAGQGG